MKILIGLSTICLSALILSIYIQESEASPQLTFSSDWSGGKRELEKSENENFDSIKSIEKSENENLDKRAPGWGKRAPGWGKRNFMDETKIDEIISRIKEYEHKATELRNFLFQMMEMHKNY
ncbi:hypothetical protein BpHYR1_030954 [Brachionus plicatilis]|uniref:Uncharacterized protein n=1 Tax=Brachionus plicatilis TaxID=10195 RepID=A0A3M7SWH6_BRAPC|nr:hypothetical protein BpHYR1_030954 [Brachionus plicatilis]